jgi:hypothetical protein
MKFLNDLNVEDGHIQLDDTYKIQWGGSNARIDGSNASDYIRLWTSDTERMRIDSSGNVGIGSASPTAKLHVAGTALFEGDVNIGGYLLKKSSYDYLEFDDDSQVYGPDSNVTVLGSISGVAIATNLNNGGGGEFTVATGSSGTKLLKINTSGNLQLPSYGAGYLKSDASGNITVDADIIEDTLDSVTTRGNTTSNNITVGSITANGNITTNTGVFYSGNGTKLDLNQYNAGYLRLLTDNTERLRVTATGNVGIGTTSPGTKLEVSGSTQVITIRTSYPSDSSQRGAFLWKDGANITGSIDTRYDGTTVDMYFGSLYNSGYNSTTRLVIKGNGNVGIGTTSPGSTLEVDGSFNVVNGNNSITHFNYVDGSTNYVRGITYFDNASAYFTGGNVGIGTTSPAQKLDVVGRVRASYDANNYYEIGASSSGGFVVGKNGGTETVNIRTYGDSHFTGGNFGIGTSSPAAKLHVYGGYIKVEGSATDQYYLEGTRTGVGTTIRIYDNANTAYIDSYNNMAFRANQNGGSGGSFRFTGGNVGIGTTSPGAKLTISETSTATPALNIETARYGISLQGDGTSNTQYLLNLQSNGGATEVMRVQSSGNVGIGTTAPGYKLSVNGDIHIPQNEYIYFDNSAHYIRRGASSVELQGYNGLDLRTAGSSRVFITQAGNVGIGTTSPNAKLDVNNSAVGEYAYFGSGSTRQLRLSSYNTVSDHAGHKINASSGNGEITLATNSVAALTVKNDQTVQLNAYGAGYLKSDASGNITVDSDIIEDTLQSVTDRGATSSNTIEFTGAANAYVGIQGETDVNLKIGTGAGSEPRMYLFGSANGQTNAGNIFIGTADNNGMVDINGDVDISGFAGFNGITAPNFPVDISSVDGGKVLRSTRGTSIFRIDQSNDGPGYIGMQSADDLSIQTNNTSKIYITSGGNVGIGTTSPQSPLTVKSSSFSAANSGFTLIANGSTDIIAAIGEKSTNGGRFHLYDGGVEKVAFYSDGTNNHISAGNVGIGTTSPSEKLEVNGNVKADNFIGGNEAGIYSFNDTVNASASEDIFSISNNHGSQAFRVTFVCSTSGYSVAKTFEVVHSYGNDPVFFKVVDTGGFGGHDFDVSFTNSNTDTGVTCSITNNSTTINADIVTTVFLGGSPTTITVTAL